MIENAPDSIAQTQELEPTSDRRAFARWLFFKRPYFFAALLPLAFALGLGAGYLVWGREAPAAASAQPAAQEQQTVRRYDVPVDDDPGLGPENAPITLIEFSDYECPYCRQWHQEVFARIRETYPDQVRMVYRDFPLNSIHPNAAPAAAAANCAREQGAFWEYHEMLFSGEYGLSQEAYLKYAGELGLDMVSFEQCVSTGRYRDEVEADFTYAARLGVQSTPTFFLNGLPLVGAQPFEVFQKVIEAELAGEIP